MTRFTRFESQKTWESLVPSPKCTISSPGPEVLPGLRKCMKSRFSPSDPSKIFWNHTHSPSHENIKHILDLGAPQDHCEMPFRVCFGSEYVALYSSDMSEAAGKKLQHEWAHFPPKYSEFVVGNTFHQQFSTTFPLRCFHQNFPP